MANDAPTSQAIVFKAMRQHKVTIRELKARTGFTLKRIRFVRENGLSDHYSLRDWLQAITGTDPGSMACARVTYCKNTKDLERVFG